MNYAYLDVSRRTLKQAAAVLLLLPVLGCGTVAEKTNLLSDERVVSESAGVLGVPAGELKLVSRTASGTNTYAVLRGKDGKEYSCTVNGGNLLTLGMVNPPICQRK
ncbi:hypothetical protein [Piscinibacterium candidicorallinum]|uniref:Uncharacterized protein n=1 Tax=Piscinibacterium candidicorallinum TaxID=1793872 RepID=A0ABV7H6W1_9BURK